MQNEQAYSRISLVVLSTLLLLAARPAIGVEAISYTVSREGYDPVLARKYLDADLALIADVTSLTTTVISRSDSGSLGGLMHHRDIYVVVYRAAVDSVLKGEYDDSTVTFQSEPITQQSTSRPISPSDSLSRETTLMDPVGPAHPRTPQVGRYLLLLRKEDGVFVCSYTRKPSKSRLEVLAEVDAKGEDYFEEDVPTPAQKYRAQQGIPRPEWVLPKLTQAYNGRDGQAVHNLLTPDFRFVPAQNEDVEEGTGEYWDRAEFISFNESLFNPEFISESGFYGAEVMSAEFILSSKRPIDAPDSNHWELTCEVTWRIFNSRSKPKPFGATYRGVACLTVKPDPGEEDSWLIGEWREESGEVRRLYR
jgi:hypothetical protein